MEAQVELDAGENLELGRFAGYHCLFNSEVTKVLHQKLQGSEDNKDDDDQARDMQIKFKEWLERFTHFESTKSVRELLTQKMQEFNLTEFEVTQLANLCPGTAEEAKCLVKSLEKKIGDEELQNLLDEMAAFGKYD
eukprot:TRINITY_DN6760_c0_g1_i2.p1 TRINITY_DN6760_c0_g1~~TRINITY_DN6760_c0_g1_i2.p1  ORF type:complete len:136 (+),score=40.40 TRINITY_DN6760_c0_g1_i2:218-625(+)